eukprot:5915998-Amphidinium_carterae.1
MATIAKALIKLDTDGTGSKRTSSGHIGLAAEEESEDAIALWENESEGTISEDEATVLVQYAEARKMLQQKKLSRGFYRGDKGGKGSGKEIQGWQGLQKYVREAHCPHTMRHM